MLLSSAIHQLPARQGATCRWLSFAGRCWSRTWRTPKFPVDQTVGIVDTSDVRRPPSSWSRRPLRNVLCGKNVPFPKLSRGSENFWKWKLWKYDENELPWNVNVQRSFEKTIWSICFCNLIQLFPSHCSILCWVNRHTLGRCHWCQHFHLRKLGHHGFITSQRKMPRRRLKHQLAIFKGLLWETAYTSIYIYIYNIHTLHYITLHYLHYITLHYITLHYITLYYITLHTYIHTYM